MFKYARMIMVSLVIGLLSFNANAGMLSSFTSSASSNTAMLTSDALYSKPVQKAWKQEITNPVKDMFVNGANLAKAPFMWMQGKHCNWK